MQKEIVNSIQRRPLIRSSPRKKSDILIKGAVEDFFPDVLRFFYQDADQIFDMSKGFELMNKELHEIQPQLSKKGGSRSADILVKVHLTDGSTELFLLHLELQKKTNQHFPYRVYQYNYRLADKYCVPIVSLAVFTGKQGQLEPDHYNFSLLGTELDFKYKTYQIFSQTEEELIAMNNPFGLVIIAAQQEALYNDNEKAQGKLFNTRMKILRSLVSSKKFNYEQTSKFLYFMDQLIPLRDETFRSIFDQEITTLFGGKITMGIMEAVREQILDEGIEKGIEQGRHEERSRALGEKIAMARELKKEGVSIDLISKTTKLPLEEIEVL